MPGGVACSIDADILANGNPVMVEIHARSRGQHDARTVIVSKDQVALDGSSCQNDIPGTDLPQALAGSVAVGQGQMIGNALGEGHHVLGVVAKGGCAREQLDIGHGGEFGNGFCSPLSCGDAVDGSPQILPATSRRIRRFHRRQ